MKVAPLENVVSECPADGRAYWTETDDGVKIRIAHWSSVIESSGTVFIFPGRTEYIEKYGRFIKSIVELGFSVVAVDWRGQGLSPRFTSEPMAGHVEHFDDYQLDVAALRRAADALNVPKPWFMFGHSMGATIGLQSVMEGFPVDAVAFTSPMWGVKLPPAKKLLAWPLSFVAHRFGFGHKFAPGTGPVGYVVANPFEGNRLTGDRDMYEYFQRQAMLLPSHQTGGPTLGWLYQTLLATRRLSPRQSPQLRCVVFYGAADELIEEGPIRRRLSNWKGSGLHCIDRGLHDLLSETPNVRDAVLGKIVQLFRG